MFIVRVLYTACTGVVKGARERAREPPHQSVQEKGKAPPADRYVYAARFDSKIEIQKQEQGCVHRGSLVPPARFGRVRPKPAPVAQEMMTIKISYEMMDT